MPRRFRCRLFLKNKPFWHVSWYIAFSATRLMQNSNLTLTISPRSIQWPIRRFLVVSVETVYAPFLPESFLSTVATSSRKKQFVFRLNVVNEDRRRFHWMNSESIFHESVNRFPHLPWISILLSLDFISRYFFSYFSANLSKLTKFKYWIKSLFTLTMSTSFDSSLHITQYCSDSSISATELEPTTSYFIKEHSTI